MYTSYRLGIVVRRCDIMLILIGAFRRALKRWEGFGVSDGSCDGDDDSIDYWIVIGNEHTDKRVLAWRITSPANETHVSKCRSHEDDTSRYSLFSHHLGRSLPNPE